MAKKKNHGSMDLKSLEKLRAELKRQARSFRNEMKGEWGRIERDWRKLVAQMTPVKRTAEKSALDVKAASAALFGTVKEGYGSIKRSLQAQAKKPRSTQAPARRRAA